MTIISQRQRVKETHYSHEFEWADCPGAGFSFDCDKDGNLEPNDNPAAIENREGCFGGMFNVIDKGVQARTHSYVQDAVGKCECGRKVTLHDPLDNFCACGACYNMSGQKVMPSHMFDDASGELLPQYEEN